MYSNVVYKSYYKFKEKELVYNGLRDNQDVDDITLALRDYKTQEEIKYIFVYKGFVV